MSVQQRDEEQTVRDGSGASFPELRVSHSSVDTSSRRVPPRQKVTQDQISAAPEGLAPSDLEVPSNERWIPATFCEICLGLPSPSPDSHGRLYTVQQELREKQGTCLPPPPNSATGQNHFVRLCLNSLLPKGPVT